MTKTLPIPLEISLGGQLFEHYNSFTLTRSMSTFIDTFSIGCNNPGGRYSIRIPTGEIIKVKFNGVVVFSGVIESKETSIDGISNSMTLSGRDEILKIAETDIDPSKGPFLSRTDNDILQEILAGEGIQFDFAGEKMIKKYDLRPGSTRVAQVAVDIARQNGFWLWKSGDFFVKSKLPKGGKATAIIKVPEMNAQLGGKGMEVISFRTRENISAIRSDIKASAYSSSAKNKTGQTVEKQNESAITGNYGRVVRNNIQSAPPPITNRVRYVALPTSDTGSTADMLDQVVKEADVKANCFCNIAGFQEFDLAQRVQVDAPMEGINNTFYVSGINYKFSGDNKRTTGLTLTPLGMVPQ